MDSTIKRTSYRWNTQIGVAVILRINKCKQTNQHVTEIRTKNLLAYERLLL